MEDRIYQDSFDLDFPEVVEDVELEEAGKKKRIKVTPIQQRWFENNKEAETKLYTSALSKSEAKEHSNMFSKLWSKVALVYCLDPFVEKPKIEVKVFATFLEAYDAGVAFAYKLLNSEVLKKLEAAFGFGAKLPIYICIDSDTAAEGLEPEVKQAFGEVCYQLQHACTSMYGLIPDSWVEGVSMSGVAPVACIYVGGNTVIDRQPPKMETFDVDQIIADHHKEFSNSAEDEEVPPESETIEASDDGSDEPKTDHFETEEFKITLKDIGFTDAQIERLYKSGALKAIAALNLDDIEDEGDKDHE